MLEPPTLGSVLRILVSTLSLVCPGMRVCFVRVFLAAPDTKSWVAALEACRQQLAPVNAGYEVVPVEAIVGGSQFSLLGWATAEIIRSADDDDD